MNKKRCFEMKKVILEAETLESNRSKYRSSTIVVV